MGLTQLNFAGLDKVQVATMRFQEFEPPEGYYLAFSGGKDSITIYDLAVKSGVKFDAHYSMPGIDPPELVRFIKANYPNVEMHKPAISIFKYAIQKGLPGKKSRWCCEALKEHGGEGRLVVAGIRWAESPRRKLRGMIENCKSGKGKRMLNPIIDWSNADVWEYIHTNKIPYCSLYDEGFKRLGCILCPMSSAENAQRDIQRWPGIAQAWRTSAIKYWEKGNEGTKRFPSGEAFFEWWISRRSSKQTTQCVMFE